MIFDLIKTAKQLFIDKTKTGVEADNVEDAISVLNSDLDTFDLKNSSSVVLDNTTHSCTEHNKTIAFNVPNMSKYRYIKLIGNCGDASGDFYIWYENKPTIETKFTFNISSATYQARCRIICNFPTENISIQGQIIGWNINTCKITQVVGYCPIN